MQPEARKNAIALAREFHVLPVTIIFDIPERICHQRNELRKDRTFGPHVIRQQMQALHRSLGSLQREGFRHIFKLESVEEVDATQIVREPLWNNLKADHGPFDIIGDVHGCNAELSELLGELGYARDEAGIYRHPRNRKVVFLGDLVDRGPDIPGVLRTAMSMEKAGSALCVPGNHEMKLLRKLRGKNVKMTHGLQETMDQLDREPPEFRAGVAEFIDDLVSHYVLDGGKLVVAHAGLKETLQGRGSGKVREFALYGETTGETDEYGLPIRYPWANEYRGDAAVVYGHTPVPEVEWLNKTICVDTGCVYGGKLTALRWPERELVQVQAAQVYCEPARPLNPPQAAVGAGFSAQQLNDDVLELSDVFGKHIIETRLHRSVTVREENSSAALEAMSRFAANPRWLVYLPPTMSPTETSKLPGLLEHPEEAFAYFRREGVVRVVCEEKHMGSRAVVIVCRDAAAAKERFGVDGGEAGAILTRTGRPFFNDAGLESALLARLRTAMASSGFWDEHQTAWALLDCELMPWSVKARDLIRDQYAAVGAASRGAMEDTLPMLEMAAARGVDLGDLLPRTVQRAALVRQYGEAYRRYSWPVDSLDDLKLAPFHLLATEGAAHFDKNHDWHMQTLARLCAADRGVLLARPYRVVSLDQAEEPAAAVRWWEELTSRGGEGMVVKPLDFVVRGSRGLVQPAVKCRGPEYLRIIYGPEYSLPENLDRLRLRGLGAKRSLALREFALGVEGLERFVRREPLRRVHECAFGVLALESEPVDPRL